MTGALRDALDLSTGLFRDGFLALLAAALVLPPLGLLLALRRLPFVTIAVPALAGGGVAFAYFLWPFIAAVGGSSRAAGTLEPPPAVAGHAGAALFLALGFAWLAALARRGGEERRLESASAVLFVVAVALSELLVIESPFEEIADQWLHHGRVLAVLETGRDRVWGACAIAGGVALSLRRELALAALDRDEAHLAGLPPGRWLLVTLALVGGASAILVPELGPEVVLALLLVPATLLAPTARSLSRLALSCALAGVAAALLGFVIAVARDWPVSPSVVVALVAICGGARIAAAPRVRASARATVTDESRAGAP